MIHGWLRYRPIANSPWTKFMPVWLQPYDDCYGHNFFKNFVDDILRPWNSYHGRFLYTINSAEIPLTSDSHLLKKSCHHSPLVLFSPLLVLVADYFHLGLSLSPATVWRAQSGFHTLRLGRMHLRESFLWKIGKTDLFMQSFEPHTLAKFVWRQEVVWMFCNLVRPFSTSRKHWERGWMFCWSPRVSRALRWKRTLCELGCRKSVKQWPILNLRYPMVSSRIKRNFKTIINFMESPRFLLAQMFFWLPVIRDISEPSSQLSVGTTPCVQK